MPEGDTSLLRDICKADRRGRIFGNRRHDSRQNNEGRDKSDIVKRQSWLPLKRLWGCLAALLRLEPVRYLEMTFAFRLPPGGQIRPVQLVMNLSLVGLDLQGRFKPFQRFLDITM